MCFLPGKGHFPTLTCQLYLKLPSKNSVASLEKPLPSAGLQGKQPLQCLHPPEMCLCLFSQQKLLFLLIWPKQSFEVDR